MKNLFTVIFSVPGDRSITIMKSMLESSEASIERMLSEIKWKIERVTENQNEILQKISALHDANYNFINLTDEDLMSRSPLRSEGELKNLEDELIHQDFKNTLVRLIKD